MAVTYNEHKWIEHLGYPKSHNLLKTYTLGTTLISQYHKNFNHEVKVPMTTIQHIIKRDGSKVNFDKKRILAAIEKAFLSENVVEPATVAALTDEVCNRIAEVQATKLEETMSVEFVQDVVEESLMKNGYHRVAKNYILYRERHKQIREEKVLQKVEQNQLRIKIDASQFKIFDAQEIKDEITALTKDLPHVDPELIVTSVTRQLYDNMPDHELKQLLLNATKDYIERHYEYSNLCARLAANQLYQSILNENTWSGDFDKKYRSEFSGFIKKGIAEEMLDPRLETFDLVKLAQAIKPERDSLFYYLGIQILIDRYFIRDRSDKKSTYELPQWFWMRVAMGLSIKEKNREETAISFYNVLSKMDLISSTPTLFNSGTNFSQMSSCYINLSEDSLQGIFKLFSDNAKLSKWAGGIGSDWTYVRATGSKIKGTNGVSQGIIPFIKIFNDVALAVNQGGKRKGAMCAYLEIWHRDFEQFMELKKNTGDERRRAHDINTACWIPDLFMKRVEEQGKWTLFCPSDTPDLHDLYGKAFEERYTHYESQNLPRALTLNAADLWRKLLTMLYETGHPWLTFKDPINLRSPQDHVGVVHSSNLCTEITLNTSKNETAVCNLASVNLAHMITDGKLDEEKIAETVHTGIRMLDNVIDNNFYPIPEAESANMKHRAVGLGIMGYQDALFQLGIPFDSEENVEFADRSQEMISYYAILASSKLAKERGAYPSYKGSKWDRGILPYDTLKIVEEHRGRPLKLSMRMTMDWEPVKAHLSAHGMRNSNTMAIAPTATIANVAGVYPCAEPTFKNIYMKENLSGNFVVINRYLIDRLTEHGLWNPEIVGKIKLDDGSIANIPEIPANLKRLFKEVFEIDPYWIIHSSAHRMKWIDQSASTNIFLKTTSGKVISDIYKLSWDTGLKTTYYLRTLGASQVQKTSQVIAEAKPADDFTVAPAVCLIDDPTCEVCQ